MYKNTFLNILWARIIKYQFEKKKKKIKKWRKYFKQILYYKNSTVSAKSTQHLQCTAPWFCKFKYKISPKDCVVTNRHIYKGQ